MAESSQTAAQDRKIQVGFPPAAAAESAELVQHLADVVNAVYTKDEAGIWASDKPFARTDFDEIKKYLEKGELALAWTSDTPKPTAPGSGSGAVPEPSAVMGCIHLHRPDARVMEAGMLVCDPAFRGAGVGRELMRFAEQHARAQGAAVTQVELLFPEGWEHPFKMRLQDWYARLGYRLVRMGEVKDKYPRLVDSLAGPTRFKVSEKTL